MIVILSALHMQRSLIVAVGLLRLFRIRLLIPLYQSLFRRSWLKPFIQFVGMFDRYYLSGRSLGPSKSPIKLLAYIWPTHTRIQFPGISLSQVNLGDSGLISVASSNFVLSISKKKASEFERRKMFTPKLGVDAVKFLLLRLLFFAPK